MTYLSPLIVLFALTPLAATAALPPGTGDEVRERLRPFGQVCRGAEACPTASAEPVMATGNSNWNVVESADDQPEPASEKRVQSPWMSTNILWPETAARITFSSAASSTMQFTHLNLAGGEPSRYGRWQNHWITLRVGEHEQDFKVREPTNGEDVLLLGRGPTRFIAQAVEEDAGETLTIGLRYHGEEPSLFQLPLAGAKRALHAIGIVRATEGDLVAAEAQNLAADGAASTLATAEATQAPAAPAERSGKAIYDAHCFACHATGVGEAPLFGNVEQWQPLIDKGMDTLLATSLSGLNLMPPMGTCMSCTEGEMRAAIQHMIDSAQ